MQSNAAYYFQECYLIPFSMAMIAPGRFAYSYTVGAIERH